MRLFRSSNILNDNDSDIIARYKKNNDKDLIGILFDRHSHLVYGICYQYLKNEDSCKDAVLTIFEKLFHDLDKYEVTNFSSWIHSVARNYCFAVLKKEHAMVELSEVDKAIEDDCEDENSILVENNLPHLNKALNSIKGKQKICVELFYLQNMSYIEITKKTGFSINEVKSNIQNGKRNLRIYLEKHTVNEKQD